MKSSAVSGTIFCVRLHSVNENASFHEEVYPIDVVGFVFLFHRNKAQKCGTREQNPLYTILGYISI